MSSVLPSHHNMSTFLRVLAFTALVSFSNAGILRVKRGSYGAPSNFGNQEYGQQNYGNGGGYGRPSGYGRPQYGQDGYHQNGNYPNQGFQGGPGGFQGQPGFPNGQGQFGQNGQFGGQQGGFPNGGQNGQFQNGGFPNGQNGGQFQQSPPVPTPGGTPGQPSLPEAGADYSTVGQTAPVAQPGSGSLFGGGAAGTGFDDPSLAADAKPAGKTTADSVTESSGTSSRK